MTVSEQIQTYIASIPDWRGERLAMLRNLILVADSEIIEEWKWGVPVFTHKGLVCAISAFTSHVKINFFNGTDLKDPKKLFNSGLESKRNRSINFEENEVVDAAAVTALIREAVEWNCKKL